MRKAIIIGGSSGIGKSLARLLSKQGYSIGLTGRRINLLQSIKDGLSGNVYIQQMDVSKTASAVDSLKKLINEMGGCDLVIISAAIGHVNNNLDVQLEIETINTNVCGFVSMADTSFQYFKKQGSGHLVGISSIAALRGNPDAPSYNASKAFVSNYLDGLHLKTIKEKLNIAVTDIRPGFVGTKMAQGALFWVASPDKAAQQILNAIKKKKKRAYITKRWNLIAWLIRIAPDRVYCRL